MFMFDIKRHANDSDRRVIWPIDSDSDHKNSTGDRYYFGDLYDLLRNIKSAHEYYAFVPRCSSNFYRANYAVSFLDADVENSTSAAVVIHLENIDPNLIRKYYVDLCAGTKRIPNETGPSDWFEGRRKWPDDLKSLDIDSYRRHLATDWKDGRRDSDRCVSCQCQVNVRQKCRGTCHVWMKILIEKFYQAHENQNTGDFEKSDSVNVSNFGYFVNDLSWMYLENTSKLQISMVSSLIYQLQIDNKNIGFAIDFTHQFIQGREIGFMTLKDSGGYFAIIIKEYTSGHLKKRTFTDDTRPEMPTLSTFLYESTYRSFYKSGECQENQFYGPNVGNAFDFDRLPENLFIKILSSIPWGERARCRRVSNRWSTISDLALSIDTKIIDINDRKILNMKTEQFRRLLGITAKGLVSVKLNNTQQKVDTRVLDSVTALPQLQYIDITWGKTMTFTILQSILDKCPKLKSLKTTGLIIPVTADMSKTYNKVKELEFLNYGDAKISDPDLIRIATVFPELTWLHIHAEGFVTNTCLSALVEGYGEQLTYLDIELEVPWEARNASTQKTTTGVFTGIGQSKNLTYLSLIGDDYEYMSDHFMTALSNGCVNLVTFEIIRMKIQKPSWLKKLAKLPNLKQLNISRTIEYYPDEMSEAISTIAREGRLEQLQADNVFLSVSCIKTCIRYCRKLKLIDAGGYHTGVKLSDAKDWINLYRRWGQAPCFVLRVFTSKVWKSDELRELQNEIKDGQTGRPCRFIIHCRGDYGFLDDGEENKYKKDFYDDGPYDGDSGDENMGSGYDSDNDFESYAMSSSSDTDEDGDLDEEPDLDGPDDDDDGEDIDDEDA